MKYNDEVFNLSADGLKNIKLVQNNFDEETLKKQNKLLKILLEKFKEEMKETRDNIGILKVKIKGNYWSDSEEGYDEITDLLKEKNFDFFASQYCIYLGEDHHLDEYYNFYEIIWDYKTYFEQISAQQIHIDGGSDRTSNNEFVNAINGFKELPLKYQTQVLNFFAKGVEKSQKDYSHEIAVNACLNEGHTFKKWKKGTWTTEELIWDAGPRGYVNVEHEEWSRTCSRCGFIEKSDVEPQELIDERKEKRRRARIKKLERELKKLKEQDN